MTYCIIRICVVIVINLIHFTFRTELRFYCCVICTIQYMSICYEITHLIDKETCSLRKKSFLINVVIVYLKLAPMSRPLRENFA